MGCPKCGFENHPEPDGTAPKSCARCGVVFAKLVAPRPDRRLPAPRPGTARIRPASEREHSPARAPLPSLGNAIVLLSLLCASLGYLWWSRTSTDEERPSGSRGPSAVAPGTRRAASGSDDAGGVPPSVAVESPPEEGSETETETGTGAGALVLPNLAPVAPPSAPIGETGTADEPERTVPTLPPLSEATVSRALVERVIGLSREFPGEESLREYVAGAYLLLAAKETKARQFDDAHRDLGEAEAWGADSGQTASFRALLFGEEQSWELAEKWARTALGYGARGNAAEMHHLIGKAYYFREQMDKAIEEFQIALSLEDKPEIRASLERAMREARASSGFDQKRLSHFIVTYEGNTMESAGRLVLDSMERSYAALVSQLGFAPTEPVVVILYSQRSYHEMGGPHWSAGLFDGKIRIPVQGLESVDDQIRATLHHELAHAFIHARAGDKVPRWLHEGLAEYLEGTRTETFGKPLAKILTDGSLEICVSEGRCDVRIFYPAATSLVEYIIDNRGMGGIRDLLTALGKGSDIDESLRTVTGRDESQLIGEWEHFVKRRYG